MILLLIFLLQNVVRINKSAYKSNIKKIIISFKLLKIKKFIK